MKNKINTLFAEAQSAVTRSIYELLTLLCLKI